MYYIAGRSRGKTRSDFFLQASSIFLYTDFENDKFHNFVESGRKRLKERKLRLTLEYSYHLGNLRWQMSKPNTYI